MDQQAGVLSTYALPLALLAIPPPLTPHGHVSVKHNSKPLTLVSESSLDPRGEGGSGGSGVIHPSPTLKGNRIAFLFCNSLIINTRLCCGVNWLDAGRTRPLGSSAAYLKLASPTLNTTRWTGYVLWCSAYDLRQSCSIDPDALAVFCFVGSTHPSRPGSASFRV